MLTRLIFSLRTLLVFVLLVGSAGGLWWRWEPWVISKRFMVPRSESSNSRLEAGASLSGDKKWLYWRAMDGIWRMYDASNGMLRWTWTAPSDDFMKIGNTRSGIIFCEKDQCVAIEKLGGTYVLRVTDGTVTREENGVASSLPKSATMPLSSVVRANSSDGSRRIVHSSAGWAVEDCNTNRQLMLLTGGHEPRGSAFSADGARMVTVCYGGDVCIYDGAYGQLLTRLKGCLMGRCVEFSEDGETLLVVGRGWDVWRCDRRRPEYWWGIGWLPEFWLTLLLTGALSWSISRDRQH